MRSNRPTISAPDRREQDTDRRMLSRPGRYLDPQSRSRHAPLSLGAQFDARVREATRSPTQMSRQRQDFETELGLTAPIDRQSGLAPPDALPSMGRPGPAFRDASASKAHKARSVAEVVAAEAGGKTRKDRLSAMKDVFSAIVNRAEQTGETLHSIISGRKQFDAYSKKMPAGTTGLIGLANEAIADVEQNGPTHKGTYYARSYATKNLPKGLKAIKTAVDDHVYYSDPKNRGIVTASGAKKPGTIRDLPREASVPQSRPVGGLLGQKALADNAFSSRFAAQPPGLLGKPADAYTVDGVDVAESPAAIDRLSRVQMARQNFDTSLAGLAPSNPPSVAPPGNMAQATPDQRMGPTSGLPGLNDYDRSLAAQASAKFDPGAVKASGLSRLGPPTDVASMPGGIGAAAKPGQITDEQGASFADPFGNYQPGGIMATASTPKMQNSLTNPETATGPTVMGPEQDVAALGDSVSAPTLDDRATRERVAPSTEVAPDMTANAGWEARHPVNTAFDDQYAAAAAPDLSTPTDVKDYNVADVAQDPSVSQEPTVGQFPDAPKQSWAEANPNTAKTIKDVALGGLMGGVPGAAMGGLKALGGLMAGKLGPGFDAAAPDRFSTGSGLQGIMGALSGPKGAQGFSQSNPGMSVTSLGNGQSLRRSEKFGWTEVVGPDGSVVGIKYDDPDKKGLLGSISKRMGGLLGNRHDRGMGISPGAQGAIDHGQGGLY